MVQSWFTKMTKKTNPPPGQELICTTMQVMLFVMVLEFGVLATCKEPYCTNSKKAELLKVQHTFKFDHFSANKKCMKCSFHPHLSLIQQKQLYNSNEKRFSIYISPFTPIRVGYISFTYILGVWWKDPKSFWPGGALGGFGLVTSVFLKSWLQLCLCLVVSGL